MHKKYSIFDKEKIVAFIAILLVAGIIGFVIGSVTGAAEEQLATCWAMCKPGSRVTVRMTPSKKGVELGWLECGDDFLTDGESKNGWIRCYGIGETSGWVYSGYVCTEKPEIIGERYVCVAKKQVACRRWMGGPRIKGKAGWIKNGQFCQVFMIADGWAVTNRGYIRSEWIEVCIE